jgi:hypothetical protein
MNPDNREPMKSIWYREPYVWLLIIIPGSTVIACFFTLWLAVKSDDGLVVDDYYKRGLAMNRTLERDRFAERYGLQANIELFKEKNSIRVTLSGDIDFGYPDRLQISFHHSTRGGFDQQFSLAQTSEGIYEGDLPVLIPGNWYVQIESDNWRLLQSLPAPL